VHDPSNDQLHYDRNYLRHRVLPALAERWPAMSQSLARSIAHLEEAQSLLDELAQADCRQFAAQRYQLPCFIFNDWQKLSPARQSNVLRYWLYKEGLLLSSQQFQQLIHDVIGAKDDASPQLVLQNNVIRRYQKALYICPRQEAVSIVPQHWHTIKPLTIAGLGVFTLDKPCDVLLMVKQREGGEKIRLPNAKQHKKLKQVLQEAHIPPWLREQLPLFYYEEKLIAVADLLLADKATELLQGAEIIRLKGAQ